SQQTVLFFSISFNRLVFAFERRQTVFRRFGVGPGSRKLVTESAVFVAKVFNLGRIIAGVSLGQFAAAGFGVELGFQLRDLILGVGEFIFGSAYFGIRPGFLVSLFACLFSHSRGRFGFHRNTY